MDEKLDLYYLYGVKVKEIYEYREGNSSLYIKKLYTSKSISWILCIYIRLGGKITLVMFCMFL